MCHSCNKTLLWLEGCILSPLKLVHWQAADLPQPQAASYHPKDKCTIFIYLRENSFQQAVYRECLLRGSWLLYSGIYLCAVDKARLSGHLVQQAQHNNGLI